MLDYSIPTGTATNWSDNVAIQEVGVLLWSNRFLRKDENSQLTTQFNNKLLTVMQFIQSPRFSK